MRKDGHYGRNNDKEKRNCYKRKTESNETRKRRRYCYDMLIGGKRNNLTRYILNPEKNDVKKTAIRKKSNKAKGNC